MTDLSIERCILRIYRHGGWSWGAQPDALLAAATRALPRLLAARLGALDALPIDRDLDVVTPVRLRIPIQLEELVALAAMADPADAPATLGERLDAALAAALDGPLAGAEPSAPIQSTPPASTALAERHASSVADDDPIVRLLVRWWRDGVLAATLDALPATVVGGWRASIAARRPERAIADALAIDAAPGVRASIDAAFDGRLEVGPPGERARRWLIAIAIQVAASGAPHVSPAAVELADELAGGTAARPVTATLTPAIDGLDGTETLAASEPTPPVPPPPSGMVSAPAVVIRPLRLDTVRVGSALPFLALVPLARAGWLDALAAVLAAPRHAELGPAIAAGLARKLLAPPARGWHHAQGTREAAAAFAGVDAIDDAAIHSAAERDAIACPVLDAAITAALIRGHAASMPVVLYRGTRDHVLLEVDGLFAIAAASSIAPVAAVAARLGAPVLVPAASATPGVLDRLDLANVRFVTDAPPVAGEVWRQVGAAAWTNDGEAPAARLARLADELADTAALCAELDGALWRDRAALPLALDSGVERSLTLAAALALADLSWTLFRQRERATPVLALDRFATLDAEIRFGPEVVTVRVPLGRRHADLFFHGYMTTVPGVPWLDGRAVELMGG